MIEMNKPMVVKIHDVNVDQEYVQWIAELKVRYRSAQSKAAVRVNAEQLMFNWELGRDLVLKKAEQRWGSGVVEQVSLDLQAAFPESKGFSTTNLWYMKQWYTFYSGASERLAQLVRELPQKKLQQLGGEFQVVENENNIKLHQAGGEIGIAFPSVFAYVPWRHHVEIVAKSKSIEEALFYILKTVEGNWSRDTLVNCIKADLYHTQGGAITNFSEQLPSPQSQLAQAITKDTYDFGFVSLAEGYKEEALETELETQLTRFLLELGTGFAYLGRQKQMEVAGDRSLTRGLTRGIRFFKDQGTVL
jgi:predicted nuclease of restriction endonuclease-like (RecB) superfamily